MSDHGHVFPRPDGVKARCGGPALCAECKQDLVAKNAQEQRPSKERAFQRYINSLDARASGSYRNAFEAGYAAALAHEPPVTHPMIDVLAVIGAYQRGLQASRDDYRNPFDPVHQPHESRAYSVGATQESRASQPPSGDAEDAAKWRALRNCARITAMGSAGCQPGGESYPGPTAHVTLNFWTHNEPEKEAWHREWLDTFVAKARRVSETKPGSDTNTEGEVRVAPHVGPGGGASASASGDTRPSELTSVYTTYKICKDCGYLHGAHAGTCPVITGETSEAP